MRSIKKWGKPLDFNNRKMRQRKEGNIKYKQGNSKVQSGVLLKPNIRKQEQSKCIVENLE